MVFIIPNKSPMGNMHFAVQEGTGRDRKGDGTGIDGTVRKLFTIETYIFRTQKVKRSNTSKRHFSAATWSHYSHANHHGKV